ncbi:transposase, partial [Galbibacter marinus]|uniref:transposase n=1 Tax=Galbibacter marinus TaxID=555500 RepID=UPI0018731401
YDLCFNFILLLNSLNFCRSTNYFTEPQLFCETFRTYLKFTFQSIADNSDFTVEVFERDINHIHFLIRYIPRLSVSQIVHRLKQESTRQLWLLHHTTLGQ